MFVSTVRSPDILAVDAVSAPLTESVPENTPLVPEKDEFVIVESCIVTFPRSSILFDGADT